jgi:hypothetical protein
MGEGGGVRVVGVVGVIHVTLAILPPDLRLPPGLRQGRRDPSQPKIAQLCFEAVTWPIARQQHVCQLQVAVDHLRRRQIERALRRITCVRD